MFNPFLRQKIQQAKQFAQDHPTVTACAVTAVVTAKFSGKAATAKCLAQVAPAMQQLQNDNGVLLLQNRVMLDFINLHGMGEAMQAHILSMKD